MSKISKKTKIMELIEKYPQTIEIMLNYRLHCIGCLASRFESLEDGAKAHGLSDKEIENMVKEMNKIIGRL